MRYKIGNLARTLLCLYVCLLVVFPSYMAAADMYDQTESSLEELLTEFLSSNNLTASNCSMAYYNMVTDEQWSFEEDTWWFGAELYKLPLAMYIYDQIAAGDLQADAEYGDSTLSDLLITGILNQETSVFQTLIDDFPDYASFREALTTYSDQSYPEQFYSGNYLNTQYMLDLLKAVYENESKYQTLLDNLNNTQGEYFRKYASQYTIAQIYGTYDSTINACAIVYADTPFVLAVFTNDVENAEEVLAQLNAMLCAYVADSDMKDTVQQENNETADLAEEPTENSTGSIENNHATEEANSGADADSNSNQESAANSEQNGNSAVAYAYAIAVFLIVLSFLLIIRIRRNHKKAAMASSTTEAQMPSQKRGLDTTFPSLDAVQLDDISFRKNDIPRQDETSIKFDFSNLDFLQGPKTNPPEQTHFILDFSDEPDEQNGPNKPS